MRKLVMACTILAGVWSLVVWSPSALFALVMGLAPDYGSIISSHMPGWAVAFIWLMEALLLVLLWAACRSVAGVIALACFVVALLVYFHPLKFNVFEWGLIYLEPTLLLIPLLLASATQVSVSQPESWVEGD